MFKLYNGKWQDTIKDIELLGRRNTHVICDPPYSERTHLDQRSGDFIRLSKIKYDAITEKEINEFCEFWDEKVFWIIIFTDHCGFYLWEKELGKHKRTLFSPVVFLKPNAPPRFSGDGPTCSCEYICISRPRIETLCGSLPGFYIHNVCNSGFAGSKPINLVRALVRDYTKPGDLIIDPYSGTGTTLIAAEMENRNSVGSEMNTETYERAMKRLSKGFQQSLF